MSLLDVDEEEMEKERQGHWRKVALCPLWLR